MGCARKPFFHHREHRGAENEGFPDLDPNPFHSPPSLSASAPTVVQISGLEGDDLGAAQVRREVTGPGIDA